VLSSDEVFPWWASTDYIRLCLGHLSQRRLRIEEGCSRRSPVYDDVNLRPVMGVLSESFAYPMFTTSETFEEAAASLTMDQTSCFWPATRAAGLNGSLRMLEVDDENRLTRCLVSNEEEAGTIRVEGSERDSNLIVIARGSLLYIILPHISI